jgi:hypothetical protein
MVTRLAAAVVVAGVLAGAAGAAWGPTGTGSGAASARTLPAGNVPTGSTSVRNVTLNWTASTFAGGTPVPAYVVRRFNAIGGAESAVLSACSGLVAATTCTENSVPTGSWKYTITPAAGSWRGTQSAQSASILVI